VFGFGAILALAGRAAHLEAVRQLGLLIAFHCMAEVPDASPADLRDVWRRIRHTLTSRSFLVFIGRVVLIEFSVLLLLGFGFAFIIHGLLMIAFRLSPHLAPARKIISFLIHPNLYNDFMPMYRVKSWYIPILAIRVATWLLLAGIGTWFLLTFGFCAQNFVCLLTQPE